MTSFLGARFDYVPQKGQKPLTLANVFVLAGNTPFPENCQKPFPHNRSSRMEVFCRKGVLRNFAKFTGKHLCQSLFFYRTPPVAASDIRVDHSFLANFC